MRVLVADDIEMNVYQLQVLLGGNGYTVVTAGNGAEALEKARRDPPDLIITDILMPVMDGFSLCREWMQDERLKHIPLIFYTATYTDERDRKLALELGAVQFIVKPEEPETLLRAIQAVIAERAHGGLTDSPTLPPADTVSLKEYNEALIRKLEGKMWELEQANHELARDIVERKEAERARWESEARYCVLFNESVDGILIADIGTRAFKHANRALCRMLGYTEEELRTMGVPDIHPKEALPRVVAEFEDQVRGDRTLATDIPCLRKDGSVVHADINSFRTMIDGRPCNVGIFRDITDRKRVEESLHESEHRYQTLAEVSPVGIFRTDARGQTTYVNPRWCQIAGLPASEALGVAWMSAVHPEDRGKLVQGWTAATQAQRISQADYRFVRPDGTISWVMGQAVPEKDRAGQIVGYVGTITDVTERKAQEREIMRLNRLNAVLSRTNQTVLRVHAPEELFTSVCKATVESGGFRLAWIGWPDAENPRIRPVAQAGEAPGNFDEIVLSFEGCPEGHGPGGIAIREARTVVVNDIASDEMTVSWRDASARAGLVALAAFPIRSGGRVAGVFVVCAGEAGQFGDKEVQLLEEVAEAISFALDYLDNEEKRQSAEEYNRHLATVVNASDDAIVSRTLDGIIISWNRGAERIYGYTEAETVGRQIAMLVPPGRGVELDGINERLRRGESIPLFETVRWRKDGSEIAVTVTVSPLRDRGGRVVGAASVARDITERKRADQQLRKLSRVVAQGPMSVVITDAAGAIEYVNPKFTEVTGYTMDEARGRNPRLLKSGLMSAAVYAELWAAITAGREWRGELHNRRKNGELFWEQAVISSLHDATGTITHYIGVQLDITEQKRAASTIHEQAALLDQANDAIYVRALDGTLRYWNAGAERLYGWSTAEAVGRTLADLTLSEGDRQTDIEAALAQTGGWTGEKRQMSRTGVELTVFSRLTLTRDAQGQPVAVMAINTDITEKKQIEARFLQAQRIENLGALASGLAHDLNNVLAPVLMATAILKERVATDKDRKMVTTMEESVKRGSDIVRQVLTFARGVKGERVPVPIRHLVREMVDIAVETFPPTLQIEMDAPGELWPVLGDATQLHQILMNLCINARDAMPEGGRLTLTAENLALDEAFAAMTPGAKAGPYVRIKVRDTGIGIPVENQAKIFEPFFTTKEQGNGTGLGLATVLGIAKSHGGFLRFISVPGSGTCFEIYLPATPDAAASAGPPARPELSRGEGQTILVVDDEPAVRSVVARILEHYGYEPICVADGSDALAVYMEKSGIIAAVVTDMVMPGIDGPALIRTLRRINPKLPIFGMTGYGEPVGLETFKTLALAALLAKPFTAETFLTTLHDVLKVPPAAKAGGSATP